MWHYSLVCDKIHRKLFSCAASHLCSARLFHMCDRTLSYVWCVTWYYSFVCVARFICMCDKIWLYVWQDSFVCVACDVILLVRVWQDSFVVWRGSFVCMMCDVILLVRMCGKNLLYVWQDSFVCVAWSCISVTWLIRMCEVTHYICDMTHSLVCVAGFICMCRLKHTGWRRLIGCLKLQVIVHKRATKYRALLRKMISKDKASYGSSPPCICDVTHSYVRRDASYLWYDLFIRVTWPIHMCSVTHLTLQRCGSF